MTDFVRPLQEQQLLTTCSKGIAELRCMVIPTFSMLQAFLDSRTETFNRESLRFQPVYGIPEDKFIGQMKANGQIPLPLYWPESSPEKQYAIGNTAFKEVSKSLSDHKEGPFETNIYDIFTALREAETPKNIRDACLYLASLVENHPKNIKEKGFVPLTTVLTSSELLLNPSTRLFKDSGRTAKEVAAFAQAKFGDIFYIRPIAMRLDKDVKHDVFIKDMAINKGLWKDKFSLGREDLREEDKAIYDSFTTSPSQEST